ncbi:MAG: hypothetical protein B6I22_13280 [Desulfobacteraceae bacterium 4572_123]|nr:MAG: hypothetical protein B6I22_13280 [Desulfobacteraceae bacterium 4572_123]
MNVCSLAKGCRFRAILLACILMVPLSVQGQLGPPQPCAQTNDTVTTLTPTLRWHAVPDADSYQIKIFQTTHGVLILRVKDDTTEAKYDVPPGNLLHFNSYKWKVRAVRADANATELSPWSPEQTFKVRPAFYCDPEKDRDCDGIPDFIETGHFKTDPCKRTLFVRPKKKIGENEFLPWGNFLDLFPGSRHGIANIPAFVDADIEVVVLGAEDNDAIFLRGDAGFHYNPQDHPDWPCDIMEIVCEQADAFFEFDKLHAGHTYLMETVDDLYTWTWSTKGYTGSGRHHGYGIPVVYPLPLDKYFEEGAYRKIEAGRGPVLDCSGHPTTDCSNDPSCCGDDPQDCCPHCSPMNLRFTEGTAFNPPYEGLPDATVEFNAISFDYYGKIVAFTGLGKQYTKNAVLARTVVHEMGHALLSATNDEHCPNPCCIMHRNTLDWEQRLFGPPCPGGENGAIACEHSPGGSKDIRMPGVIHNTIHLKP